MKLKSTFTTLRSNTGWRPDRTRLNVFAVLFLILFIGALYVFREISTSAFLSPRERITVGIYDQIPYIFSYDKKSNLGTVVYYNPDVQVQVPGGYGWYKVGSVQLLAHIENKTAGLLNRTFANLSGVPVDWVIYRNAKDVISGEMPDFLTYFMQNRELPTLFSKNFAQTTQNLIDKILISHVLSSSPERLIVVDAREDYVTRDGTRYYTQEKLDSHLKGYLYQKNASENAAKVQIFATKGQYKGALLIARLIEGMGIKVLSVDQVASTAGSACVFQFDEPGRQIADVLHTYFPCTQKKGSDSTNVVMSFYLSDSLATLYK